MTSKQLNLNQPKKSYKSIILATALTVFQLNPASNLIPQVHAEGVALSTFPTTLQLRAQAPADMRSGFSLSNQSSQTVKLNILLRPFKADPSNDGKVQYLEGNDPKLLKRVQIIDNG